MSKVSRKGFVDKNGQQVVLYNEEEYAGTAVEFSASEAIDAILTAGVHRISYQADGKKYPTKHILVVYKKYGKPSAIKPNRYMVMQTLIDWFGIHNRRKLYIDEELTEPDGDWTDWVSIPAVTGSIVEGSGEALTSGGAYDALLKKANYYASQLTIHNEGQSGFPVDGVQGVVEDLDDFIASTTADAKYHAMVTVYKDSSVAYFPCLISWTESNNTKTVIILVSHYTFTASRNDSQGALWDQEFTVVNNSSFFEVL